MSSLIGIVLHFRINAFAVLGDIKQVFRQIDVPTTDEDVLWFMWRDNGKHPVEDYIMNVYLFGNKDSSCCCQLALKKAVPEKSCKYPQIVSDAILEHFYVGDYFDSFVKSNKYHVQNSRTIIMT